MSERHKSNPHNSNSITASAKKARGLNSECDERATAKITTTITARIIGLINSEEIARLNGISMHIIFN